MNKFPLRAKHKTSTLEIEFESENWGTVIIPNASYPRDARRYWPSCFDSDIWEILPPLEPSVESENKKEMKLPDEFYILTENAAYWAAIEAKLLKLGYKYSGSYGHSGSSTVKYDNWAYIRGDKNKELNHGSSVNNFQIQEYGAVKITMAELFAIPDPPAFVEKSIFFQGYDGTIKEDRIKIGCQTIKYENLAEIKQKVDEFMSLEFLLNDKFEDTRTNVKINHEGITVTTAGEIKTISFSSFFELLEELSPALKPKNK